MSLTDVVILLMLVFMLLFALYDTVLMDRLKGKTRLKVPLIRRNRIDGLIFVGLIGILIYNNIQAQGEQLTTTLLLFLAAIALWTFWIRQPKCLFKKEGFFFANVFIHYSRIKTMNLSEDGILVIELENRPLYIRVKNIDDLESIYKFMIENQ